MVQVRIEKERLENLSSLGADITRVLVAECHVPDKSIKIDTASGQGAKVHLHEELTKMNIT